MNNNQNSIDATAAQDSSADEANRIYRPTSPTAWQRMAEHSVVEVRGEYGRARFRIAKNQSDSALFEAERMYRNLWSEHHRHRMAQDGPIATESCEIPDIVCRSRLFNG